MAESGVDPMWFSHLVALLGHFASPQGSAEQYYTPLHQATMPLQGFLGPQQTASSPGDPQAGFATWLNTGIGHQGREWLVPLLTPNQHPDDVKALLSGERLSQEQDERVATRAWEFARQYEGTNPGTFAKYPTSIEATAAALGPSKNLFYRFPPVPERYPGR
jgi:hypothetical protein